MDSKKLVETIKVLVRTEMTKTLKPMLKQVLKPLVKEMVESKVNAVLAERYVQSLSVSQVVKEQAQPVVTEPPPQQRKQIAENRRKELMKKLGVGDDPMSQLIYGDIDVNQSLSEASYGAGAVVLKDGQIVDPNADDDGIDLSMFGL